MAVPVADRAASKTKPPFTLLTLLSDGSPQRAKSIRRKPRFVPLRCLIVDDSPEFLDAARRLLQQEGMDVAGVASTGDEAVRLAHELRPDVALVDIDLGGEDGLSVARRLADDPGHNRAR